VGHYVEHMLAIELQRKTDDTVRGRMVRSEVHEHELGGVRLTCQAPFLGTELQQFLFAILQLVTHPERFHFGGTRRMVLAQRMPFPERRAQDAAEVRMTGERETK